MNAPAKALSKSSMASIWPSPLRAWVSVIVLMVAYATAFVDRQIITLLVEPISQDLGITDTEFSLLSGLAPLTPSPSTGHVGGKSAKERISKSGADSRLRYGLPKPTI